MVRPRQGWLRAVREATGVSASEVAKALGTSRQAPLMLEKSEAEYRITLGSLRNAAEALGCELVYGIVPRTGSFAELAERGARAEAMESVLQVEHSMALENQAAGGVAELVEDEARRGLAKGRMRR